MQSRLLTTQCRKHALHLFIEQRRYGIFHSLKSLLSSR